MNLTEMSGRIREEVTMEQILALYGYVPRRGYICCPFHGEKTPSLRIYPGNRGWYCFGCGRGGNAVDFVMAHEGCSFRLAVHAIDKSLGLGLADRAENPEDAFRSRRIRQAADAFAEAALDVCDALLRGIELEQAGMLRQMTALKEKREKHFELLTADEDTRLLCWEEEDQYCEYRKEKVNGIREEVIAWHSAVRRAVSA